MSGHRLKGMTTTPASRTGHDRPHYWPVPPVFILGFAVLLGLSYLFVNVASYAYSRVGLGPGWAVAVLVASTIGSWFNLPIFRFRGTTEYRPLLVRAFGVVYVVPRVVRTGRKILAVNVGGALIPTLLSGYLIVRNHLGWGTILAVAMVALVTHGAARVVPGVGIVVPTFIPPLVAALAAWIWAVHAVAALAYVAGTMGTLIGADVANLPRVRELDAPVVSIGGAGTFDGIFVTGIVAVLLAAI